MQILLLRPYQFYQIPDAYYERALKKKQPVEEDSPAIVPLPVVRAPQPAAAIAPIQRAIPQGGDEEVFIALALL